MNKRRVKAVALVALVLSFVVLQRRVQAAYYDCIGSQMVAIYYGDEVTCESTRGYCEQWCGFCFETACDHVIACVAGQYVASQCKNIMGR